MQEIRPKRSFKKEFKRQLRLAIAAAAGFLIAFAWREAIFDAFQSFLVRILDVDPDHYLTETYTAILLTLVGVIVIYASSKLLRD